jgi:16S rRNA (cytosine967-C5)-methyltransferase
MDQNNSPGLSSRKAALRLLDAVLRRGQPLETALNAATQGMDNGADRALAHAIASETLRRLPDLDDLIDGATRQRLPDDSKARLVLRIALVQALILETPHHAVVSTALPLVEGGPRRLVHGVLGNLLRQGVRLRAVPILPVAVEMRWQAAWGQAMIDDACRSLAEPPPTDLTLKDAAQTAHWVEVLQGETCAPGHVRIGRNQSIPDLPGFEDGAWWVQNIAASVPVRILGPGEGRTALDLCAAPGGKSMQLAASGWNVTAVESNPRRLARVQENLERTQLHANLVAGDIFTWEPQDRADVILLDAPCSATGIFVRHPDVLHRVRPKDIMALAETQVRMLTRAAPWLKAGGRLIYATCSLEPEEGEAIVEHLKDAGLRLQFIDSVLLPPGMTVDKKGWVRILPTQHRDGFFVMQATTQ